MRTTTTITIQAASTFTNWPIWFLERPHRRARHQRPAPSAIISIPRFPFSMKTTFPAATGNRQGHFTGPCISLPIRPSRPATHRLVATNTRPVYLRVVTEQIRCQAVLDSHPTSTQGPIIGAISWTLIRMSTKPANRITPALVIRLRCKRIYQILRPHRSAPLPPQQSWEKQSLFSIVSTISGPIIRVRSTGSCISPQIRRLRLQTPLSMNSARARLVADPIVQDTNTMLQSQQG